MLIFACKYAVQRDVDLASSPWLLCALQPHSQALSHCLNFTYSAILVSAVDACNTFLSCTHILGSYQLQNQQDLPFCKQKTSRGTTNKYSWEMHALLAQYFHGKTNLNLYLRLTPGVDKAKKTFFWSSCPRTLFLNMPGVNSNNVEFWMLQSDQLRCLSSHHYGYAISSNLAN